MLIDSRMVQFLAKVTEGKKALVHITDYNNVEITFPETAKVFNINGNSRDGVFYIDDGFDCHAKVSLMTVDAWLEANV